MEALETQSIDTDTTNADDPLQDLTDEQLYQLVEETLRANDVLAAETQMFEKFLARVEPKDPAGGVGSQLSTPGGGMREEKRQIQRKSTKSRSGQLNSALKLTAEQKCDISQREIEELREDIEKDKEESEKTLDHFKAIMEETEMRLSEMKKESYEFERDIVKGSLNHRTNKVIAEKALRYFDDKLRARDTLIEKLRLKNSTLKVQKKKLMLQLKQKEEMGEVLHEVDFNQLKIENQQYLEKIDERNQDLLRLKFMSTNTLQVQNSYKKKLTTMTKESERLQSEITLREDLQSRIKSETEVVELERAKAEQINKKLRRQLSTFRVPEVMEYVMEKADLYDIQKKVKSWERKVDIAEMALKTHRNTWRQMSMTNAAAMGQWRAMAEA